MSVYIIADPGSTHGGYGDTAQDLVDIALDAGCDAIKFQLFPNDPKYTDSGNIFFDHKLLKTLIDDNAKKPIEIFASCFDLTSYRYCIDYGMKSMKLAYSMRECTYLQQRNAWDSLYISGDIFTNFPENAIRLFCIPEYPVKHEISFDGLFPERFDGFSDHTLGYRQTLNAVRNGAKYIEKHIRPETCVDCPDSRFALKPTELEHMVKEIRLCD